jgi:membrane protein DedA with SNARE-associated domain
MDFISGIVAFIAQWIAEIIRGSGYIGIFILMSLESANIPIPSEIVMSFSGFLAFMGDFSLLEVIIVGSLGNLFGSIISYFLASYIVKNRHKIGVLKFLISDDFLERANKYFERYGSTSVFFSRMLPIVRTFISLPAGLGKMDFTKFSSLTLVGSVIWSAVLAYLGWVLGNNWNVLEVYFRKFDIIIVAAIIAAGTYWFIHHFRGLPSKTSQGK